MIEIFSSHLLYVFYQVKEPDYESLMKHGKVKYLPPRFMTVDYCCYAMKCYHLTAPSTRPQVNIAIQQLLQVEEEKQQGVISPKTLAVGMARLGQETQKVRSSNS